MDNITPPSADEARAALREAQAAEHAVRDTPWPVWLYPVNALLLGSYALATLVGSGRLLVWLGIAAVMLTINVVVGRRMGTPWIVPTSRGFQVALGVAAACMVAALVVDRDRPVAVIVLAAAAVVTFLVGSVLHRRSTGR